MRTISIANLVIAVLLSSSRGEAQPSTGPASPETGSLADIEEGHTEEPKPERVPGKRSGTLVIPRIGFGAWGWGSAKAEADCSASVPCVPESVKEDFDDDTTLLTELDVLFHLGPELRLGGGLLWVPSSYAKADNGNRLEWGQELAPLAIVEGIWGKKTAGTVRGFIGPSFVSADGELKELVNALDRSCGELAANGISCDVESGPFLGLTLGAALGFVQRIDETLALRADVTLQYLRSSGPALEADDGVGGTYEEHLKWSLTRIWLSTGAEF